MKSTLFVVAVLSLMASSALAQEATKQDDGEAIQISTDGEDKQYQFSVPADGEPLHLVVDVYDQEDATKVVETTPTYVSEINTTNIRNGGSVYLRGGASIGLMSVVGRVESPTSIFGLVGELAKSRYSMWRLQATLRAGNCADERVAINADMALMGVVGDVSRYLRAGIAADLLVCGDLASHPMEVASERLIGSSLRVQYERHHVSLTASLGLGADTVSVPGDRETRGVLYGGLTVSLWGN